MKLLKVIILLSIVAVILTACDNIQKKYVTEQTSFPKLASEVTTPVTGAVMHEEYVKTIGRMAYVWGWPVVNSFNRRAAITQAPEPGRLGGVIPVAPRGRLCMLNDYVQPDQSFVACPNQDVAYGAGFYSLDEEPVVIQVPDFGDRFWIYALYDARTDQFGELGKPYGTKPGFYLLVGPNWNDKIPAGITAIIRSSTEYGFAGPRVFMNDTDEDRAAIKPLVNQINAYPLTEFDGNMKIKDWNDVPSFPAPKVEGENKWVVPEKFFDQLPGVMAAVPPLPGEEALYATIKQVLDAAQKDPQVKQALVEVAVETEKEVIGPLFLWKHNGIPAGNGWNRSANNADWGYDYLMRTSTARSNMFDNRPNETQYFYTDGDSKGNQLESKNLYAVTFPKGQLPPVKGFWSLTLYNKHHIFTPNELNRYSLGTKNKTLKYNEDGSLTLYAGANPPGNDMDSNWLPAPEGTFSLYIRCYWGDKGVLDGTWQPPVIGIEKPSVAELHAYKAMHHANYMKTTAAQAGGTNKLLHTTKLPTEGTDPVVTPALDHLYTKAVIDLTSGPVTVEFPEEPAERYFSIHITDQEHYTIYDEIRPVGKYVFVRKGKEMVVPEGAKVIESPGDYPHLFIRVQVKTAEDLPNTIAIQEQIKLTGESKTLDFENSIEFTLASHDVYPQNKGLLASVTDFSKEDYMRVMQYVGKRIATIPNNMGGFGPIDSKEPHSNDPEYRATAIIGHLGLPAEHALYAAGFVNCEGQFFNGDKTEVFTLPYKPQGVKEFWSVTRYSFLTRNTLPGKNDLYNAYNTEPDKNGDVTITFSVEDPKDGTYWMPVNAGEGYYFVIRYYKPDLDNMPPGYCD